MITQKDLNGKRVVCKACGCAPVMIQQRRFFGRTPHLSLWFGCGCNKEHDSITQEALCNPFGMSDYNAIRERLAQRWYANYGELLPVLPEYDPRDEYALMGEW